MKKAKKLILLCITILVLMLCSFFWTSALNATGQCGENVYWNYNSMAKELVVSGSGEMWEYYTDYKSPFYKSDVKSIIINKGVTTIGSCAFYDCNELKRVTIPESVTYIDASAFLDCSNLTDINIPNSVTSIASWAFSGCKSLVSINIPKSVIYIGTEAFDRCMGLLKIIVDGDNTCYSNDSSGVLFDKGKTIIYQYPLGNSSDLYTIPETVKWIEEYAFRNCDNLTTIIIPDNVEGIKEFAFVDCDNLKNIIMGDGVLLGYNAFHNTAWYNNQPEGIMYMGNQIYDFKGEKVNVVIKEGTTTIGSVFSGCGTLKSIVLPNTLIKIEAEAFANCYNLKKIVIPSIVQKIGAYSFFCCGSLESIEIPEGVSEIQQAAFAGCSKLTGVTIPDSTKIIEERAFMGCSLTEIYIPKSVETIGDKAIGYRSKYFDNMMTIGDKIENFKIIGIKNSVAEKYAKDNGFIFVKYNPHTHSYTAKTTKQATCAATGYKTFTCSCDDTYTEKISKKPHTYKTTTTKATLKKNGKTVTKCTVCGTVKSTATYLLPEVNQALRHHLHL